MAIPIVAGLCAAAASACSSTEGPAPTTVIVSTKPTGTLIVSWTIEDATDAASCTHAAAVWLQVRLETMAGVDAGTYAGSCSAFSTSIVLGPGTYQGSATMLDGQRRPRSSAIALQPFTVLGGDVVSTSIDFPADAFTTFD